MGGLGIKAYYESSYPRDKDRYAIAEDKYFQMGTVRKQSVICMQQKQHNSIESIANWKNECKQRHNKLEQDLFDLKSRIKEVLPANLPTEPKSLTRNIDLKNDHIITLSNRHSRTYEETNSELHNQCKELFSRVVNTTDAPQQTSTEIIPQETALKRTKRAGIIMAALSFFATTVFSIGGWWVENYFQNREHTRTDATPGVDENNNNTDPTIQQIITDTTVVSDFTQAVLYTTAVEKELQIMRATDILSSYIKNLSETLKNFLFRRNFNLIAHDFWRVSEYNVFKQRMYENYEIGLPNKMSDIDTQISHDHEQYILTFTIPIEPKDYRNEIYHITPLAKWNKKQKFIPDLDFEYVAISTTGSTTYTILSQSEAEMCISRKFCTSTNPSFRHTIPRCSICTYFGYDDCCQYKLVEYDEMDFKTIQDETYYSLAKPLQLEITCKTITYNKNSHGRFMNIEGIGFFSLHVSCEATYNDIQITPTMTRYSKPSKDVSIVTFKNHPQEQPKNIQSEINFDIQTLDDKSMYKKYLKPMLLGLIVLATTLAILIILLIINKIYGPTAALSFMSSITKKEIGKIARYRKRRKDLHGQKDNEKFEEIKDDKPTENSEIFSPNKQFSYEMAIRNARLNTPTRQLHSTILPIENDSIIIPTPMQPMLHVSPNMTRHETSPVNYPDYIRQELQKYEQKDNIHHISQ